MNLVAAMLFAAALPGPPPASWIDPLSAALSWILPLIPSMAALSLLGYYCLGLPLRREHRAQTFLDILETGILAGYTPERTVVSASASRDFSLGVDLHLLAAHLEKGHHLIDAMAKIPHFVPPQVAAMLNIGFQIGNLRAILPACRKSLTCGLSQTRAAVQYQIGLAVMLNPCLFFMPFFLRVITETFGSIYTGYGARMHSQVEFLLGFAPLVWIGHLLLTLFLIAVNGIILGGPGAMSWLESGISPFSHKLLTWLPWRRYRLLRDFSAMLACLLEHGIPEVKALPLAAAATGNQGFAWRVECLLSKLQQGHSLPDSLQDLDASGEFAWRMTNALHSGNGFQKALSGWHEWLEANAFRQEQMAAHALSTSFVLVNGLSVAIPAVIVFSLITGMYQIVF